jgi:hypothetical protein
MSDFDPTQFGMYIGTPFLINAILIQWIQELRFPRIDLDLSRVSFWRWVVALPFILWGFWYPPYEWGVRYSFFLRWGYLLLKLSCFQSKLGISKQSLKRQK